MEPIELLDSSDSEYELDVVGPRNSNTLNDLDWSSDLEETIGHNARHRLKESTHSSDSTITQESTNTVRVRLMRANASHVEIALLDSDSSVNEATPCERQRAAYSNLELDDDLKTEQNSRKGVSKDHFQPDSELESSFQQFKIPAHQSVSKKVVTNDDYSRLTHPAVQNKKQNDSQDYLQSDLEAGSLSSTSQSQALKYSAKQIKRKEAARTHSHLESALLPSVLRSQQLKPVAKQKKRYEATQHYNQLDSESPSSSSRSQELKRPAKQSKRNAAARYHLQVDSESESLPSFSQSQPLKRSVKQNEQHVSAKDHSDVNSESESLCSVSQLQALKRSAKQSKRQQLTQNNFNFDSESSSISQPVKRPAKQCKTNNATWDHAHLDLESESSSTCSQSEPLKRRVTQNTGDVATQDHIEVNSELKSLSSSSYSQPLLQRPVQHPEPAMLITLSSSGEDEDFETTCKCPPSAPQQEVLSQVVSAPLDFVRNGCKTSRYNLENSSNSDKSLVVLESSTDEETKSSVKWIDSKQLSKPNKHPHPIPGTKKQPKTKDDCSDSSIDSLIRTHPFSIPTKGLKKNGNIDSAKVAQKTFEVASSDAARVSSSREVTFTGDCKVADYDDSDGEWTQESSLNNHIRSKIESTKPNLSASKNTTNAIKPTSSAQDDVPTPALPSVNEIGGRLYPDLRHQCIKALISHAKVLRRAIHQRGALDASIRAVIVFSFYPYPIRSPEAAANLKGVGSELLSVFKDMMKTCSKEKTKPYCPPKGKFSSVASASLIALDDYEREQKGPVMCSMEDLITRINNLCHNPTAATHILDRDVEYYLNKENIDPGWLQIRKLCAGNSTISLEPLIKERKKKTSCTSGILFELTDQGREQVKVLRRIASSEPVPPGPLRQLASSFVDKAFGSVTMSMDIREGGGYTKSLHKLCNLLDEYRVPYVVRSLKISDYVFFVGNKLAPILIERKSVDDVASSLVDGRWESQQRNMRRAQYVLGKGEQRKCQICYIIEGEAAKRIVHGGVVARTSWDVSLEQVENAVASLPQLGFSVMKSKSHMGTMNILAQVARDICWKYRNGSIDCLLTYDDFLREMGRCSEHIGDPPTRPEHMNPVAPVVDSASSAFRESRGTNINNDAVSCQSAQSPLPSDHSFDGTDVRNKVRALELEKLSISELKELCIERDEKVSGTKKDLIERLLEERKPEILLTRNRRNQYVPKLPSSNAALLVALLLNHTPGTEGLSKERLMLLADETGVSKDPMGGKGGWYDGWSGMKEMTTGDPPLVSVIKRKYSLTTQPTGSAGIDVARALHTMAHRKNLCRCGSFKI